MAEFSPEDGAIFFAWRNTFCRVNQRTYDYLYFRADVVDSAGEYLVQEIPFQSADAIEWVRLIHERTFDTEDRVARYVAALHRRYAATYGPIPVPLRVMTAHPKAPQSSLMYYDNGTLVLPAPSSSDLYEDPSGDIINRERFIASRWQDGQRHWPIAEHHVLHELAHHISGSDEHGSEFERTLRNLLGIASEHKNCTPEIWDWESKIARELLERDDGAVDMVTGAAYDGSGTLISDASRRPIAA